MLVIGYENYCALSLRGFNSWLTCLHFLRSLSEPVFYFPPATSSEKLWNPINYPLSYKGKLFTVIRISRMKEASTSQKRMSLYKEDVFS